MEHLLTTRQIQELIRVDRITVYRMLKDGRLRGFKVGGQWRFPRREIEAWLQEQQTPADLAPLSQTLPLTCITSIQALCAEAMDIAVVTTDLEGRTLTAISNSCDFCALILASDEGLQRCAGSWRQRPDGEMRACHAGLLCASATIAVHGQPVALAATCQFTPLSSDGAPHWHPNLASLAADLGLAEADLQARLGSVRTTSTRQLLKISKLVRQVAGAFSEIGQERVNLLGRLEKIAEMSKL